MIDYVAKIRLTALVWAAVFLVSGFLEAGTIGTVQRIGLFGTRRPLPLVQTIIHVLIAIAALVLSCVFRAALERVTLLIAAAAAGSTALYGFGLRSSGLSAFRLLSHLAVYALLMFVAGRGVTFAWREYEKFFATSKDVDH